MLTSAVKRDMRIQGLYKQALAGQFTTDGEFHYDELVKAAKIIGVQSKTAVSYADTVVNRLKRAGHLK